jgi:two-component system, NarL family, response regulator LiaR
MLDWLSISEGALRELASKAGLACRWPHPERTLLQARRVPLHPQSSWLCTLSNQIQVPAFTPPYQEENYSFICMRTMSWPPRHSGVVDVRRLLLVDDYRMVTEALASRLSTAPDLWVAGCCSTDDPQLPEVVRWLRPDVILIEVEPLGFAVGEVLTRLKAAWPSAHVVVVSGDHDPAHAVDAARAGAAAWVSKEQGADDLETVLRGVCQGHSWFPPEMLGEIIRELREDVRKAKEASDPLDVLSPRERDVLASMAEGKRGRQIAEELLISTDTVRTHTRSIFSKLDVHSRLEAVRVARAAGLRPPERNGITGGSTTVPFRPTSPGQR